jgi:hypothetical protein
VAGDLVRAYFFTELFAGLVDMRFANEVFGCGAAACWVVQNRGDTHFDL